MANKYIEDWISKILADPITKSQAELNQFEIQDGVIDARIFLRNSSGYIDWLDGQNSYEDWESNSSGYQNELEKYSNDIKYDAPIYEYFNISGDVLDVGGGVGTLREFLDPSQTRYISIDPFIDAPYRIPAPKKEAYTSLKGGLNFISGMAEFLPFLNNSFDWVHMRSMLDHVQVPDLALIEAHRVLKINGCLLVGLSVEGGESGRLSLFEFLKENLKKILTLIGIDRFRDMHTWHPSYKNLLKLIESNGFVISDVYWQPYWRGRVVYILAVRQSKFLNVER